MIKRVMLMGIIPLDLRVAPLCNIVLIVYMTADEVLKEAFISGYSFSISMRALMLNRNFHLVLHLTVIALEQLLLGVLQVQITSQPLTGIGPAQETGPDMDQITSQDMVQAQTDTIKDHFKCFNFIDFKMHYLMHQSSCRVYLRVCFYNTYLGIFIKNMKRNM
ncbi:hypothetical protein Avbf_00252 [Armadillidium vulgare]|nr:hypothetical protein Avbf_00252 [Armadillidium vulgare]